MTMMAAENLIAVLLGDPEYKSQLLSQLCFSDDGIKTVPLAKST